MVQRWYPSVHNQVQPVEDGMVYHDCNRQQPLPASGTIFVLPVIHLRTHGGESKKKYQAAKRGSTGILVKVRAVTLVSGVY